MHSLPEDVMLIVINQIDLDTFLTFRLCCRQYQSLINSHINSICKSIARNTFRTFSSTVVEHLDEYKSPINRLRWLKWQRYEQLAAIILERTAVDSVPAGSPAGESVRTLVARAWHCLAKLARIADGVRRQNLDEMVCRLHGNERVALRECDEHLDYTRSRELEIAFLWLREIERWACEELQGYQWLMSLLVEDVFQFPGAWDQYCTADDAEPGPWWVAAWINKSGLGAFWQAWCMASRSSTSLKDVIEASWGSRDELETPWTIETMRTVERQVRFMLSTVDRVSLYRSKKERRQLDKPWLRNSHLQHPHWQLWRVSRPSPGVESCFQDVPFHQPLDWKLFGWKCDARGEEEAGWRKGAEARRRMRSGFYDTRRHNPPKPVLHPDCDALLQEWRSEWLENVAGVVSESSDALQERPRGT